ncbi:hypothetical protein ACO0QE_001805 [Hanseniaspora vineae]
MTGEEPVTDSAEMKSLMSGRQLFKHLGEPKKIVAPMVDQSELAWRMLSRKYGADLCYTPMFHAKLFATSEKYRQDMWQDDLDGNAKFDRPLVVQFCANDPQYLIEAAKFVDGKCDGIDLNLGCPQGIARKGHYGSFLMEDWKLISELLSNLKREITKTNVTCKIRIFPELEKSLEYAQMCVNSGAEWLTVHGRLREQKGQITGLADWNYIKHVRENIQCMNSHEKQVVFANGNILYSEDIDRCLSETGCDAVMSAEGNLYNPGIFNFSSDSDIQDKDKVFPRVDLVTRDYFEILKKLDKKSKASMHAAKSHLFKILRPFFAKHTELRNKLGPLNIMKLSFDEIENQLIKPIEDTVAKILKETPHLDVIENDTENSNEMFQYKKVPYWRCQPYFRSVNGVTTNKRVGEFVESRDNKLEFLDNIKKRKKSKESTEDKATLE